MKLTITKVALALPLAIATMTQAAVNQNIDSASNVKPAHMQNIDAKRLNAIESNRYFVLLKDAPIALYNGEVKGLAPTSMSATKGKNATARGKLNTKSSASVSYKAYLNDRQADAKAAINRITKRSVNVKEQFSLALNAMVMELTPEEVAAVEALPEVIAVTKEERQQLLTDRGPSFIGAPGVWDGSATGTPFKGEGMVVGVMDTGITTYTAYAWNGDYSTYTFHPSFIDPGQDGGEGYDHVNPYGEGVYFGMCVDAPEHCNDKLVGVISYPEITSQYSSWQMNQFGNGRDSHGHGTHVASTIAGNPVKDVPVVNALGEQGEFKFEQVTGVAPNANIISYQTCHPTLGCWPSLAVKSIEHAIENNVDVMNYSVGGSAASPWYLSDALAMLSAREAGVHIAVAAGNAGPGEKTIGSPGNSPWVTTVAAYTHDRAFTGKTATFTGGAGDLPEMSGEGATSGASGELIYMGDIESQYHKDTYGEGVCGSVDWSAKAQVAGKILVCNRGGVNYNGEPLARVHKSKIAKQMGAIGMILVNVEDEYNNVVSDFHSLPTIHINKADGETLRAWMATGSGHSVSFNDSVLESDASKGDIAAPFSSRGPDLWEGDYLVPDIAAPGVDIFAGGIGTNHYSGIPYSEQVRGDFRFMSGTSMATPHVAGALVLVAGSQPTWTAAEVQSALMLTAERDTFKDDNYSGVLLPSTPFDAGAGSTRISRAVKAGLVMNETKAGYLAANPLAEETNTTGEIEGWHGEPSQMNMPSLAKKGCLIECSWTRTFKATKAGDWTIKPVYDSANYELTFTPSSFTVAEGDEVEVNISAKAQQGLNDEWVFGKMVLVPSDADTPEAHLPVAVNFIAGIVPENFVINTGLNEGSQKVDGIKTIGTNDLQVSKTGLAKADIHEFEVQRDDTNHIVVGFGQTIDSTLHAIPLNVQARTKRLVVDVLEASSPDIDLYIGYDGNLDGEPDIDEFYYIRYISGGTDSDELIDIIDPEPGTYWILTHNFAPPVEGEPEMDTVKLSVATVKYDDDTLTTEAPTVVAAGEEVDFTLNWSAAMEEGDLHYAAVQLGISAELPTNIGTMRVTLNRTEDEAPVQNNEITVKAGASKRSVDEGKVVNLYAYARAKYSLLKDVTYEWTQVDGPTIDFGVQDKSGYSKVTFVAPEVDEDTYVTFSVVAKSGKSVSKADTVSVKIKKKRQRGGSEDDNKLRLK
ncbi:S8 family serine peptidase [Colwellia sp. MEBiC06753]